MADHMRLCDTCSWHHSGHCTLYNLPSDIARCRPLLCGPDAYHHEAKARTSGGWMESWWLIAIIAVLTVVIFFANTLPRINAHAPDYPAAPVEAGHRN